MKLLIRQISSLGLFVLLFLSIAFDVHGQKIPQDLIVPICSNQALETGAPENSGINNLWTPCGNFSPLSPYLDFYYIKILEGTKFVFSVTPYGRDDYDFAAFLNPDWDNINNTPYANKRGSQNSPVSTGKYSMGLSLTATDVCEQSGSTGNPEPGFVRYFDVKPGDEILICIDRWSRTTRGYSMDFDGGDAILDCTILGDTYSKCEFEGEGKAEYYESDFLSNLEASYPEAIFKFYYEQKEAEANSLDYINFPIVVTDLSGKPEDIYVRIETETGSFISVLKLLLQVKPLPILLNDQIELPKVCANDASGDGLFDLTQANDLLVSNPDKYEFKYFVSEVDAINDANSIGRPQAYTTQDGSIYVRIESKPQGTEDIICYVTARLDLKVSHPSISSDTLSLCNVFNWNGQTLTNSGRYEAHFQNAAGCDSTAFLQLTIFKDEMVVEKVDACGSFSWKDQIYDQSGRYEAQYVNVHGCDSTEVLELSVYPNFSDSIAVSVCKSFYWPVSGQTYNTSGIYAFPMQSIHGCDSIGTLQLVIYPEFLDTLDMVACEDFYWSLTGDTYHQSGLYVYPLQTVEGCDSLVSLSLQINPVYFTENSTHAYGDFVWSVNNQTYSDSGIFTAVYTTAAGCDSVYVLHLTVEAPTAFYFPNAIAKGGANSAFTGYSNKGELPIIALSVYDRWGSLVFHNENFPSNVPEEGWDGTLYGRDLPTGVYVWIAVVENKEGTQSRYQGDITIIR
ncbi:MAG: gliding motility-associated C-terminal domain-containing protein [Chitinophagales bacterium]|nr:gliding motility-associated C-terminal domain-containing protein [Chitinophagales bacterium]